MSRRRNPRRKHARAEVDWPVTVASGNGTLNGRIKNLSRGGAFLDLAKNLELHEQIRLAIEIPEFEDVIYAKAEVIRTSSVIPGKNFTSFAVAVKFTEISNEDLRYFTGNLAPEWQEGYEGSSPSIIRRSSVKLIGYALAIFFLISIPIYALILNNNYQIGKKQVAELENRINIMEEKLTALKRIEQSESNLENQVKWIQNQLVTMHAKFKTFATVDNLQYQTNYFEEKIDEINNSVKPSRETGIILTPGNKKKSAFLHYSVQEGDNLYRIGIKHGISVNKIKELNNFSQNEPIYPGQKLIVGWNQ
jgi:LysM repeat protein